MQEDEDMEAEYPPFPPPPPMTTEQREQAEKAICAAVAREMECRAALSRRHDYTLQWTRFDRHDILCLQKKR